MSEMVERVAKVVLDTSHEYLGTTDVFQRIARAAIAAMREPTDEMWRAPARAEVCVNGILPTGEEAEAIWQAMIDEALK